MQKEIKTYIKSKLSTSKDSFSEKLSLYQSLITDYDIIEQILLKGSSKESPKTLTVAEVTEVIHNVYKVKRFNKPTDEVDMLNDFLNFQNDYLEEK